MSPLHERLWEAASPAATACLDHPFVTALRDGTLPREVFRRYVAQDACYLKAFYRAYALAAARLERVEHLALFHTLLGGVLEELEMHGRTAERLGIDLDSVEPLPATRAYVEHLERLGWEGSAGEILAGMVPCMRLYAWLGTSLNESARPDSGHPYRDWIAAYSSPEFLALCDRLESLLDEIAEDTPEVREAYRVSMDLERDFFEAALCGA